MKYIFNLFCLTFVILLSHYASANQNKFKINAEVIDFDDYIENGGELGSKENGKLRLEGKEYLVKDGDIIHFKFNV